MEPITRWRVGHLVGSWVAYWGALVAVTLSPAVGAGWRASRPEAKGSPLLLWAAWLIAGSRAKAIAARDQTALRDADFSADRPARDSVHRDREVR